LRREYKETAMMNEGVQPHVSPAKRTARLLPRITGHRESNGRRTERSASPSTGWCRRGSPRRITRTGWRTKHS